MLLNTFHGTLNWLTLKFHYKLGYVCIPSQGLTNIGESFPFSLMVN